MQHGVAISLACTAFGISETCYRHQAKREAENEEIANWLIRLTDNDRNWGFGLCYLYLRNVKDSPGITSGYIGFTGRKS